jgi:hypothetical protein
LGTLWHEFKEESQTKMPYLGAAVEASAKTLHPYQSIYDNLFKQDVQGYRFAKVMNYEMEEEEALYNSLGLEDDWSVEKKALWGGLERDMLKSATKNGTIKYALRAGHFVEKNKVMSGVAIGLDLDDAYHHYEAGDNEEATKDIGGAVGEGLAAEVDTDILIAGTFFSPETAGLSFVASFGVTAITTLLLRSEGRAVGKSIYETSHHEPERPADFDEEHDNPFARMKY